MKSSALEKKIEDKEKDKISVVVSNETNGGIIDRFDSFIKVLEEKPERITVCSMEKELLLSRRIDFVLFRNEI